MRSVKENLIAAKALIDTPEKWAKGEFETEPGCLCAYGAIARAIYPYIDFETDEVRFYQEDRALEFSLPEGWRSVDEYNDAPETTHADIMALFDRAIAAQGDA